MVSTWKDRVERDGPTFWGRLAKALKCIPVVDEVQKPLWLVLPVVAAESLGILKRRVAAVNFLKGETQRYSSAEVLSLIA